MGATNFKDRGFGRNVREAFNSAVDEAQYRFGHDGYTGTIAEKDSVIEFEPPPGLTPEQFLDLIDHISWDYESDDLKGIRLLEWSGDQLVDLWDKLDDRGKIAVVNAFKQTDDKWGPAGAICLGHTHQCGDDNVNEYVFFGWASD